MGIVVFRHQQRPRERIWIIKRVKFLPNLKCHLGLGTEAAFKQFGQFLVPARLRLDPLHHSRRIVDLFLSRASRQTLCLDAESRGLLVQFVLPAVPLRRLVAAPRGSNRYERENDGFRNLQCLNPFRFGLRSVLFRLIQLVSDFDIRSTTFTHTPPCVGKNQYLREVFHHTTTLMPVDRRHHDRIDVPMGSSGQSPIFEVLFESAEPSPFADEALAPYGNFGFPPPPNDRPWIYTNFVQSLDGIVSLLGKHASGAEIAQSRADRWLMDLLRAHADGVIMGMNTLREEQRNRGPESRGIVFQVADPGLLQFRKKLGKSRQRNIFVTRALDLDLSQFKCFDGDAVDVAIVTSPAGTERLSALKTHPHVTIIAPGTGESVDLSAAVRELRAQLGIKYLLCEGGPTLYGNLARADLVDEKFLTVSPLEIGQEVPGEQERLPSEAREGPLLRPTVFAGPGFTRETMTRWTWLSSRKSGDHQFNRYRRMR